MPVNQGMFVHDIDTRSTRIVAKTGALALLGLRRRFGPGGRDLQGRLQGQDGRAR